MKNKGALFLMLCILLTFTPGCWDIQDINNSAFVMSIGIDPPSNPATAKFKVTFEFAKPRPTSEGPTIPSTVASIDANSLLDAIQRIQTSVSQTISLSHLRVVAVGGEIAKQEDFLDLVNYLLKEPDVALQLRLIFAENTQARDLFYTYRRSEDRLGAEIVAMGLLQQELALVRTNNFLDFISDLKKNKGTAFGSRVSIQPGENIIIRDGAAVFKENKLAAWLNAEEAQGANWLVEDTRAVVTAREENKTYTYQVRKQKRKVQPVLTDGKPSFIVKVSTVGMILEESGDNTDLSKTENLERLESLFANSIKQQVEMAIQKSQLEIQADYLDFNKAFRRYYAEEFKSLDWNAIYPTIPIDVQVDCEIEGYGLHS